MIIASEEQIQGYTQSGAWGSRPLADVFDAAVAAVPDQLALIDPPDTARLIGRPPLRLTYRQLDEAVDRLSARLLERGFTKDDVIAVQLPNTAEFIIAYLAAARLGLVLSPLPSQWRLHELEWALLHIHARGAICCAGGADADPSQTMAIIAQRMLSLRSVFVLGGGDGDPRDENLIRLDGIFEGPVDKAVVSAFRDRHPVEANDVLTVTWSAGAADRPLPVPHSHNNWLATGSVFAQEFDLAMGAVLLDTLPPVGTAAIGGTLVPWLLTQGTLVLHQPFDIEALLIQIRDERPAYLLAPAALAMIVRRHEALLRVADVSSLKAVALKGPGFWPKDSIAFSEASGLPVSHVYCNEEGAVLFGTVDADGSASPSVSFRLPGAGGGAAGQTPGAAYDMTRALLLSENSREPLAEGSAGRLAVAGPGIAERSLDGDALSVTEGPARGFTLSHDVFQIGAKTDELIYRGRCDTRLQRGGTPISPAEIEQLVESHGSIAKAVVVGVPDRSLGERVGVCVVPLGGAKVTLADIRKHLESRQVSSAKIPDRLVAYDELPLDPQGEIDRAAIRKRLLKKS